MAKKPKEKKYKEKIRGEHTAVDILEQAFHLLRSSFTDVALLYAVGTIPFILCLLFFIFDMEAASTSSPLIARYGFYLATLYFLKNWLQSLFCRRLMSVLVMRPFERLTITQHIRIFLISNIVQPLAFLAHYFSYFLLFVHIPYSTSFFWSFYTTISTSDEDSITLIKKGLRVANYMPMQNLVILVISSLASLVIALNSGAIIYILPWIMNTLLGIETTLMRFSGMEGITLLMQSSTFWSVILAVCYLVLDPFLKAVYVLRVYYAESFYDGADILSDISRIKKAKGVLTIVATSCLLLFSAGYSHAADVPVADGKVQVEELDTAIEKTLKKREYNWRTYNEEKSLLNEEISSSLWTTIDEFFSSIFDSIGEFIKKIFDWFDSDKDKKSEKPKPRSSSPSIFSGAVAKILMYLLAFLCVGALLFIIFKAVIDHRRRMDSLSDLETVAPEAPDLNDENVTADALEEDQWRTLADELIAKGEFRLAMRAQFLAVIALLADNSLLTIARYKTNRDYYYELKRRYHYNEPAVGAFSENLDIFEQVWYGDYNISRELVEQFIATCRIITE